MVRRKPRSPLDLASNRWLTLVVFAVAFLVRIAFWQATPDRAWPHSALYKGDAVVWTNYAAALEADRDFELGLPLRPPANGYLLSWLGVDGPRDVTAAQWAWCFLGALAVVLFYRAVQASFGPLVGLLVALWCSFSTALLMLSTSLNNETPYLVGLGLLLRLAPRLAERLEPGRLLLWGALNGLLCLVRVEHALFFVLSLGWLGYRRWRGDGGTLSTVSPRRLLLPVVSLLFVLFPWHVESWAALQRFNRDTQALPAAAEAAQAGLERALGGLHWTPEAELERSRLPAFARRSGANFVAATVAYRGRQSVLAQDFSILEEAFGYRPKPLAEHPFVALYGPLNFYLAQRPEAPVGFDPQGLDRKPPLAGGAQRYPPALIAGLPPRDLNFNYPPHVEVVNDGYRLGREAIRRDPGLFLRRSLARLDVLWQGASLGWTGRGAPFGLSGLRRAVDLTVPEGAFFAGWRVALLIVCLGGVWIGRRNPALGPWLLLALSKAAAGALFFGYARHGATLVPVVALLAALVIARFAGARVSRLPAVCLLLAALALGGEAWRWFDPPQVEVDGRASRSIDPHPVREHVDRRVTVR